MKLHTQTFTHAEISPEKWDSFLMASPQATIFAFYGYINCICSQWEAIIVRNEAGEWLGVMPLVKVKKYAWTSAQQPLLSQHWGVFLAPNPSQNQSENSSFQKKIVTEIISELSKTEIHVFHFHFSPKSSYLLPFYWENYELKTRYTYQITLSSEAEMLKNVASPLLRQLKKANKNHLIWEEDTDFEGKNFLYLWKQNIENGRNISGVATHSSVANTLSQLIRYFHTSQNGKVFIIKNIDNQILAAGLFSFANGICTYHAGCQAQANKDSSAMAFLLWKTALYAQSHACTIFDFEGSMIAGIEQFFRKFGAIPVPYLAISRNQLPFYIKWIQTFLSSRTKRLI